MGCEINFRNTGQGKLCPPAEIKGYFLVPDTFKFSTLADAKQLVNWQLALQAAAGNRMYKFPIKFGFEDASEEATREDGTIGVLPVRDGRMQWRFLHATDAELHKKLRSFRNSGGFSVILIDVNNNVYMTSSDGIELKGISIQLLDVEKAKWNDGTAAYKTPVYMVFEDANELQEFLYVFTPSFNVMKSVESLTDAVISVVNSAAALINVKVNVKHTNSDFQAATFVFGLDITDFRILNSGGVSQSFTFTDNEDGTYSLVPTPALGAGAYTVDLKPSKDMTTLGYESIGAATFTI